MFTRLMNWEKKYGEFHHFFLAVSKTSRAVVRILENIYGKFWLRTSKLADFKNKQRTTNNSFHMLGDWLLQ